MNYKVGDKVINKEDLGYLFNPYHKKEYRKYLIRTVTEANDTYFSIYKPTDGYDSVIKQGLAAGCNEFMLFRQETGKERGYPGNKKLIKIEDNQEYIFEIIKEIGEENIKKEQEIAIKQINSYKERSERKVSAYQKDIEDNLNLITKALTE